MAREAREIFFFFWLKQSEENKDFIDLGKFHDSKPGGKNLDFADFGMSKQMRKPNGQAISNPGEGIISNPEYYNLLEHYRGSSIMKR